MLNTRSIGGNFLTTIESPEGDMLANLGPMEHEPDKIHVISLADGWEVESQSGVPLAHENDKCDAIDTAKQLAQQRGIETVILHHGDGVTEELPVPPVGKSATLSRNSREPDPPSRPS